MWEKQYHIYNVDARLDWNKSHAQLPVADVLNDRLRIYYSSRNSLGQSNISFIEVDKDDPRKIIFECNKTLLNLGSLGSFDDSGIMPSSIINVGEYKYLYYVGWTTRQTVPYQNAVGLAISYDGGSVFQKVSEGPVISINHIEPYFSGTAFVMFEMGVFKMWYLSCTKWEIIDGRPEPFYNMKYAESSDGIIWKQTGKVSIELDDNEGGIVSASVIKEDGIYKMWYGKRGKNNFRNNINNSYRIGYAESIDGITWERKDNLSGIDISLSGWDSEMISYPCVYRIGSSLMMLYNGNGFGRTGFGYAVKRQ